MARGKLEYKPITLNAIANHKRVGEVRFMQCMDCYSLVHPLATEMHEKRCTVEQIKILRQELGL